MTNQPSWQDMYGRTLPNELPPAPRHNTLRVDDPACPQDCTGQHGVDSLISCVTCRVPAYQTWWHEYRVNRGVNFHVLVPVNGAPPLMTADMPCPVCGGAFTS